MDVVMKAEGISKKYCRSLNHTMLYGATDLARRFLGIDQHTEHLRRGEFWAVDDLSFELKRGECLGIIGSNGSGKSTLLKMMNGIFMPDRGRIDITGRIGALIEVGAGFHPMLTGRENIYVNGSILGMSKNDINRKFDSIVEFADIGEFLDSPVKHYSSGMHVRLGFSVAIHCNVDMLLIDEVLAVGDLKFVLKCHSKMADMRKKGVTTVIVSHNVNHIRNICSSALWLDKGKLVDQGNALKICDQYEKEQQYNGLVIQFREERIIQYVNVDVKEYININLTINDTYQYRDQWILSVGIKNSSGQVLVSECLFGLFKNGNNSFSFYNQLRPGFYTLTLNISEGVIDKVIEWNQDFFRFEVPGSVGYSKGLLSPQVIFND